MILEMLAMSDYEIIIDFLEKIKVRLAARIPVATGKTVGSLEVLGTPLGGQLLGAAHIGAVEYGRGPRKTNEDEGMWMAIQAWLQAKGKPSEVSDAVGLTRYINKYGTQQFQLGTPSGIISEVINNKALTSLTNRLADANLISLTSEVLKGFKTIKVR